jgi:phasin family protein
LRGHELGLQLTARIKSLSQKQLNTGSEITPTMSRRVVNFNPVIQEKIMVNIPNMPNMPNMQNMLNPVANIYQTQLEASRQFADAVFSGTEKVDQVLLEATHRAFTEQLKFAQSLIAVRDPQDAANVQASYLSQRPDRAMNYQRELIRVFTEIQTELGKSMRNYVEQLNTTASNGPSASLGAMEDEASEIPNPMPNLFSLWESAFRQAASLATQNMNSARNTFEQTAQAAYGNASEAMEEAADTMTGGRSKRSTSGNGKRK